jgi:hypothetical protein
MNRVLGDYFENLLYKVFVSIDSHTTVGELAGLLRLDIQLVKDAVSVRNLLFFVHLLLPLYIICTCTLPSHLFCSC